MAHTPPYLRLSASFNPFYYGFYMAGLRANLGETRWMRPAFETLKPGMTFTIADRRIYLCAEDSPAIDPEALEWCDLYAKVNARAPLPGKVVPIGPSFGVTEWTLSASVRAVAGQLAFGSQHPPREVLANQWRQWRYRVPEPRISRGVTDPRHVFFAGTIWRREPATNEARACFLRTVRERPELEVDGGFAPRSDGYDAGLADLIVPRVDYRTYLARTRRSAFVFNTPAVLGCHGWKLGEFLAMGKAIISTRLLNEMPAPFLPGTHYHLASPSSEAMHGAIDALADAGYRSQLEENARRYYVEHLAPDAVIRRIAALV